MTKRNKDLLKNIGSGVIIIGVILYIYFIDKKWDKMIQSKLVDYTIGEINDYRYGYRVSASLDFFFFIDGKRIDNSDSLGEGLKEEKLNRYIGKRYLIRFNTEDPKYNEIVWDKPVPDSLVQCCRKQVWDEPPF